MKCTCKNSDGTFSDKCFGVCKLETIVEQKEQQREPMNGFAELILSQVDKMIDAKISNFRLDLNMQQIKSYQEAFLAGIKEGIAIGRDMVDY